MATSAISSTRCSAVPREGARAVARAVVHVRKCAAQINTPISPSLLPTRTTVRHARLVCAKPASMNQEMLSAPTVSSKCGYPKGVKEGQSIRLRGQGSPGFNGGPAGDLYMEVEFEPDARYRVEGRDVTQTVPVAPWEAALGATIEVPTPSGASKSTCRQARTTAASYDSKDAEFRAIHRAICISSSSWRCPRRTTKRHASFIRRWRANSRHSIRANKWEHNDDATLKVDAVLIDEETLDLQELASACAVPPTWVIERVEAGLLACNSSGGEMRFASAHLVRARRMVTTERRFDANQEVAALVADLIEEIEQLRRQVQATAKGRAANI